MNAECVKVIYFNSEFRVIIGYGRLGDYTRSIEIARSNHLKTNNSGIKSHVFQYKYKSNHCNNIAEL